MMRFETFGQGCDILEPILLPKGFRRSDDYEHQYPSLTGGGEVVIRGGFERDDRRLELELWFALRRVVYHVGDLWLEHEPYLRALGVPNGSNSYPGFSEDPLDGFRHLASDLTYFAEEFLSGDAAILRRAAAEEAARRPEQQRRYKAWMVGDDSARRRARELFRQRQYGEVVTILTALQYPEFMDRYELTILEAAKRRASRRSE
jgi:hypothetical protein